MERVDNDCSRQLPDDIFIYRGWNDTVANDLTIKSREPEMLRNVPRDASERFCDMESARAWHDKTSRIVYSLGNTSLAGVIWYGYQQHPTLDAEVTFAIRMYKEARGKQLGRAFMHATLEDLSETIGYDGAIWLETNTDNLAARRLYENVGYTYADELARPDRLTMIWHP